MTRLGEWWASRIGPLLGIAYAYIAMARGGTTRSYQSLIALLVSATLLAAYAYVVNDSCDVDLDRSAGKPNSMSGLAPAARVGLALTCAAAGLTPWIFVAPGCACWLCLGGIVGLPVLYSVAPVRLKQRGAPGLISDALNVHTLPVLFVAALILHGAHTGRRTTLWFTGGLALWSLGLGLRSITRHQLLDHDLDARAGVRTFVVVYGVTRSRVVARRVFFPMELAGLAALSAVLGRQWPVVLVAELGYLMLYCLVWTPSWRSIAAASVPDAADDYVVLVEFYQLWPALLMAGCATAVDPRFGWLLLAHLALFAPTVRKQGHDLWKLCQMAATRQRATRPAAVVR